VPTRDGDPEDDEDEDEAGVEDEALLDDGAVGSRPFECWKPQAAAKTDNATSPVR
jgi:hypothetical protein